MLQKGIRLPTGAKAYSSATPRPSAPRPSIVASVPALTLLRVERPSVLTQAVSFESATAQDEASNHAPRVSTLRLTAEAETVAATPMTTVRFVVPHFVTKPGQQLFFTGSTSELGEWDPNQAVPLEWREGHQHVAQVRLPVSRVVQVKLMLKENGRPVLTEEDAREVMLMPVAERGEGGQQQQQQGWGGAGPAEQPAATVAAAPEPVVATLSAAAGPQTGYQILCHFGLPEATQILRLPVVLPPKASDDRRVLCKFVVMLDHIKLEPRQYPVVVGSCEELGSWNAESGVKLMRQVGGYWARRVELPLLDGHIQAKVVICNSDGQAAAWEPGTANRVLSASQHSPSAVASAMHIFLCRWSQPDHTAVVSVPVEYERADKEFLKQLDAAQREIGIMRRAVTAKSRQCQSLESELAASRRAERSLRDEVAGLRSELGYLAQEVEVAQRGELAARQESVELQKELQHMRDNYELQITFMESKLDEMEQAILTLQQRLASTGSSVDVTPHDHYDSISSNAVYTQETPPVYSRSNWR